MRTIIFILLPSLLFARFESHTRMYYRATDHIDQTEDATLVEYHCTKYFYKDNDTLFRGVQDSIVYEMAYMSTMELGYGKSYAISIYGVERRYPQNFTTEDTMHLNAGHLVARAHIPIPRELNEKPLTESYQAPFDGRTVGIWLVYGHYEPDSLRLYIPLKYYYCVDDLVFQEGMPDSLWVLSVDPYNRVASGCPGWVTANGLSDLSCITYYEQSCSSYPGWEELYWENSDTLEWQIKPYISDVTNLRPVFQRKNDFEITRPEAAYDLLGRKIDYHIKTPYDRIKILFKGVQ